MGILEIIAEERLGRSVFTDNSELKSRLQKIEKSVEDQTSAQTTDEERQRIATIVELCFEYDREKDSAERENILRTLEEIARNEPVELPKQKIDEWENEVASGDRTYAKLKIQAESRIQNFLKKYFSLRARAGLKTQADVAKKAGLSRTHVTVLESGEHMPQQKTLQKLAKAFGVDVTELM